MNRTRLLCLSLAVLLAACRPAGAPAPAAGPAQPDAQPPGDAAAPTGAAPAGDAAAPAGSAAPGGAAAGPAEGGVAVNQVGYLPAAPKRATAWLAAAPEGPAPARFDVVPVGGGEPVFSGILSGPVPEPEGGKAVTWQADFSALQAAGVYRVRVLGVAESPPFAIGPALYREVYRQAMRSYYLQRCGMALEDSLTGVRHGACHLQPAALEADPSVSLDVSGGWHDAGDYGRYMPTAAVTVGQLLMLAEWAPAAAAESLGGTDLLAEVRYELDWMLKMQREDGAVYHKVTTERFPGWIMPEDDTSPLLVYGVSTAGTAGFAAAAARAARAYAATDPDYARRLADAAVRAWQWLEATPFPVVPPVGRTGPYLTASDGDDRLWAAAELFALTGEPAYNEYVTRRPRSSAPPPSWDNVTTLALWTYVMAPGADAGHAAQARELIRAEARARAGKAAAHPYGVALAPSEYRWASNKTALAAAVQMLMAHRLDPDPALVQAAADQLHWVLGRNPLGQSYVTGLGVRPPLRPHHRLAEAGGRMVPGLLVGGPNSMGEDGIAPKGRGPRSYVDELEAYSVNEPAIDYNAPLVVVAGWLAYAGS